MKKLLLFVLVLFLHSTAALRYFNSYVSPTSPEYQAKKGNMIQYRPGDVIIGGLLRVHKRGIGDNCSTLLEDGIQAIETINMIVDQVNADPSILRGIKLGTLMVDTCDTDTHAVQRSVNAFLLPYFWAPQTNKSGYFAGIVGASSSAVSIQTASILQIFKIPQVSPWSTHPDLSNKNRFPYFFRTVPSDSNQAKAMVSLLKMKKWNYISIVYEDDFYGIRGYREVQSLAVKEGICIAIAMAIPRNPSAVDYNNTVSNLLLNKRAKAVVVFTKSNDAEQLISAAHANPQSRGYFKWIGSDGWSGQLPTISSKTDYRTSLEGSITFQPKTRVVAALKDFMANLTLGQHLAVENSSAELRNPWFPEFIKQVENCKLPVSSASVTGTDCPWDTRINKTTYQTLSKMQSVANAVLSFVYALKNYQASRCRSQVSCGVLQSGDLATRLYPFMKNVSYTGVNGDKLSFDVNQDGQATYDLHEYLVDSRSKLGQWKIVGSYRNTQISMTGTMNENVTSVCSDPCKTGQAKKVEAAVCCWLCQNCLANQFVGFNGTQCVNCPPGSIPNKEKTKCNKIKLEHSRYDSGVSIGSLALAAAGIVATIFVAVVFFIHRESAIVKASGRELCVFVLFGAFVCFVDSFVLSTRASDVTCATSRVFVALGPTMMYAGLLTKTIRVVIIFQSKSFLSSQVKTFLQPKFQILTTIAFIFVQAFVVTVWFAVSPPATTTVYPSAETGFLSCKGIENLGVLVGLAYPFVLILVCTVLATINRNVPTGFNETQFIGFTMYATCVIWLAFLPIFITNASDVELKVATLAICLSLSAVTVLVCLFGYRCYVMLFQPERNTSKSVMTSVNDGERSTAQRKETNSRVERNPGSYTSPTRESIGVSLENRM